MSELYFSYGIGKSFTSMEMANQKKGYANPIRELLQNSLDASREAGNGKCEINIHIDTIEKHNIPNIKKYEEVLESSIKTLQERNGYTAGNKQAIKNIQKSLKSQRLKILMFVDNGTGMNKDKLENLLDEISSHADNSAGGSYGVGHISSFYLSSLRYVLYATKFWNNRKTKIKTLYTGSTILAGHKSNNAQRGNKGRIVSSIPENEKDPEFDYPTEFPNFIQSKMDLLNKTGSMIAILGLNEDWSEDAEYAIASNFFHSIAHDGLSIKIHQNGETTEITGQKVEELLSNEKTGQQAKNSILSGQAAYQAYQAIKENNSQQTIELTNGDKVYVYIKKVETESSICLVRNGMLIARHDKMLSTHINSLRKNSNYESFVAVIDVDKDDSKRIFEFIRNAENMYHNALKNKKEFNQQNIQKLRLLLEELSEKIKEHLTEIKRESFDMPFFEMPNRAKLKGGNPSETGKNTRAKTKKMTTPRPPKICSVCNENPCICKTPLPKSKKNPEINLDNLESDNEMRCIDKGKEIEVKMRIKPTKKLDNNQYIYFYISVAEDNDNNTRSNYVEFISVFVDNNEIPKENFIRDDKQVILGKFGNERHYNITAIIKKPDGFNNMKISLEPILGLKKHSNYKENTNVK